MDPRLRAPLAPYTFHDGSKPTGESGLRGREGISVRECRTGRWSPRQSRQTPSQAVAIQAKPKVEKARQTAIHFAREHEDEVKQTAARLIRTRIRGPLGLFFDALTREMSDKPKPAGQGLICPRCQSLSPVNAKFCIECGYLIPSAQP